MAGAEALPPDSRDVTAAANVARVFVAGIGNIFFGDDGFGVEVVRRLAQSELPPWVHVADFGIRGIHLAFELVERECDTTILVDATPQGGEPGTVYLIEADTSGETDVTRPSSDPHGMNPQAVFALVRSLGGMPGRVFIVGCEPAKVSEGIGLSEPVARAVDEAVNLVIELVSKMPAVAEAPQGSEGPSNVFGDSRQDRRVS
jgi:hydrogenase maturation protease